MTEWTQFKADRRNAGLARDLEGPYRIEEGWTTDLAGSVGSPVLARDTVFVGTSRGTLYALEADTGRRRWVVETISATDLAPIVTRDLVAFATAGGTVHAVDPATGDPRWETDLPGGATTPLSYSDGRFYAGHEEGISALEAETGELLWSHETDAPVGGSPAIDDDREWDGPRIFAGTADETVLALEAETGEQVWEAPADGAITAGPTIADGRVYVGDDGGTLLALSGDSGQTWFTYEIRGSFTTSATVVEDDDEDVPDDDTTFVGADDGYLHVTDTSFGRRKVRGWLFSKKGIALDGEVCSSPVVVGDVVCVGDSTGSLYGIDADEYDHLWHFPLEGSLTGPPAVGENRLYAGTDGERLYCLEWTPGAPKP
ncbi:outer membrane protein assembly factor BamB family protein [Natrarchaeobius chitinivorans]|uniref:Pyrrolo-quinoline quinone n=1 Tax=Natrarchaeobius chitinivorans TaxID=1679083 RepID=A0A3N6LWP2_NATCH|nr:PQQ-binding-like beta-propeller repeat protein [Natrarchaeobius chitinivorans]RQG95103.1 pyrrolo-quinoline quinone [Natrarchaeobius chitinivorans]